MVKADLTARSIRRRLARRVVAFVAVATLVACAFAYYTWRERRRDFVALVDARTGRTIAELEPGWMLIGESDTHAVVERSRKRRSINLPDNTGQANSTIGPLFSLGGTPPPADGLSWWSRPPEIATNASLAQVDGDEIVIVRSIAPSEGCFSVTLESALDGHQLWRTVSDFGKPADLPAFVPPTISVSVLAPPSSSPTNVPPRSTEASDAAPPTTASPVPPPTPPSRVPAQAPDGSYPCPFLRSVKLGRSLVSVSSDGRTLVFDRATGKQVGQPFDSTYGYSYAPMLLGGLIVTQGSPTTDGFVSFTAVDPRTSLEAWTEHLSVGQASAPARFLASAYSADGADQTLLVAGGRALAMLDQRGKTMWEQRPVSSPTVDAPSPLYGSVAISGDAVVVQTANGFAAFDRTSGKPLWRRAIGAGRNPQMQVANTSRTVAITFTRYRD